MDRSSEDRVSGSLSDGDDDEETKEHWRSMIG